MGHGRPACILMAYVVADLPVYRSKLRRADADHTDLNNFTLKDFPQIAQIYADLFVYTFICLSLGR